MSFRQGVALEYSGDVPKVIAKARGSLLEKIIAIAEKNNITIYTDPDLAEVLYSIDTGREIPVDLYRAVAEVLAFCYRVNCGFKRKIEAATAE